MKLTIFTTIFGDYDTLKEPLYTNKDITYLCFTDQDFTSKHWKIIKCKCELTPRRQSRIYKILSHRYIKTKVSLYIDGSCRIHKNPFPYIKKFLDKHDFVVSKHTRINCIYKQTEKCILVHKADKKLARKQLKRFKNEGFPKNINSVDNKVILRMMTPEVKKFELDWWREYMCGCQRDQTAFGYIAWKDQLKYGIFKWKALVKKQKHLKNEKYS